MNQELQLIAGFIVRVPRNINLVFEKTDFLERIEQLSASNLDGRKASMKRLLFDTSESAYSRSNEVVSLINNSLKNEKETQYWYFSLEKVGLTKSSLAIKGNVFTLLWELLEQTIEKGITYFSDNDLITKFSNALKFLSDFLGSMKVVFPDLEELKELIELLIGLLNLI